MNNISIIGRIGADPELKYTKNNTAVCSFSLAVKRPFVKDVTDWLNVTSWRARAEYLCKYGRKGDLIAVEGILTTRKYQDKTGANRTDYEILANTVQILGGSGKEQEPEVKRKEPEVKQTEFDAASLMDDEDLPF